MQTGHLSVTDHACILIMFTVFYSPVTTSTVNQWSFCSTAHDVIHPDRARSLAIPCAMRCRGRTGETKLTANHMSVIDIPVIITHCAPLAVVINFNSAIINTAIRQTNVTSWREKKMNRSTRTESEMEVVQAYQLPFSLSQNKSKQICKKIYKMFSVLVYIMITLQAKVSLFHVF